MTKGREFYACIFINAQARYAAEGRRNDPDTARRMVREEAGKALKAYYAARNPTHQAKRVATVAILTEPAKIVAGGSEFIERFDMPPQEFTKFMGSR